MSRHLSPGAQLLKNSRLFSLPPPLPRPTQEARGNKGLTYRDSETATLPYPIQQAIATPPSSLQRGDWGLKRNLPLAQTTNISNPAIRIKGLDTIEHITDYESATDHTRTLEKFQELSIAITRQGDRTSVVQQAKHIFDNDDTTPSDRPIHLAKYRKRERWKYYGPDLSSITEHEFQLYLKNELKGRMHEFEVYWKKAAEQDNRTLRILNFKLDEGVLAYIRDSSPIHSNDVESIEARELESRQPTNDERWLLEQYQKFMQEMDFDVFTAYMRTTALADGESASPEHYQIAEAAGQDFATFVTNAVEVEGANAQRDQPASSDRVVPDPQVRAATFTAEEQANIDNLVNAGKRLEAMFLQSIREHYDQDVEDIRNRWRKHALSPEPGKALDRDLYKILIRFLDIPEPQIRQGGFGTRSMAVDDPLTTHPSAGMSYLRTNSVLVNHPLFGPQTQRTPVQARVLRPRDAPRAPQDLTYGEKTALLGVAGFVASEPRQQQDDDTRTIDVKTAGGKKIYYQATGANINANGQIELQLSRSSGEAISIHEGQYVPSKAQGVRGGRHAGLGGVPSFGGGFAASQSPAAAQQSVAPTGEPSQSAVSTMKKLLRNLDTGSKTSNIRSGGAASYPTS